MGRRAVRKVAMFEADNIREWRGHDVVDVDGHKIGELEAIYVDTATDLPSFGTVTIGMPGRRRMRRRSLSTTGWNTSRVVAVSAGSAAAESARRRAAGAR